MIKKGELIKTIQHMCDADLRNTNNFVFVFSGLITVEGIERAIETERQDKEFEKEWGHNE